MPTLNFFSQEPTKKCRRLIFVYWKVRDLHLCHLMWVYLNLSRFCFSVTYVFCLKKTIIKKLNKIILPTYLPYLFWACNPNIYIFWPNITFNNLLLHAPNHLLKYLNMLKGTTKLLMKLVFTKKILKCCAVLLKCCSVLFLHFVTSNQTFTSRKLNLALTSSIHLAFLSLEMQWKLKKTKV